MPCELAPVAAEESPEPAPKKKSRYKTHSEEIAELKERMAAMESLLADISSRLAELTVRAPRRRRGKQ